jgi:TonB-dependent receptor
VRDDLTGLASRVLAGLLLLAVCIPGPGARAQEGEGTIIGQVIDAVTGLAVEGVTVTVIGPPPPGGGAPAETSEVTDPQGAFTFPSVPAGRYSLRFVRSGYRESRMTDFAVAAGQLNRADFPLPPLPAAAAEESGPVPDIEEFVVIASPAAEILAASRMDSDELINTLSAEDLSKFAASDVADALKFVPGVNVVEGQFAIIRGLEDRYSSTLYNGAPVPSPDPDKQSVQLDLFPSDVVNDLVVAKTFAPDLPSNSSGGSINIITHDYPEDFELKLSAGTGFNENAIDDMLEFVTLSPIGKEGDAEDTIESEFGASLGGRSELFGREVRFKGVFNREVDYETKLGSQESREPEAAQIGFLGVDPGPPPRPIFGPIVSGDLSLGELGLSGGLFDLTESERSEQLTGYVGLGFDLDSGGSHRIDGSAFYTEKEEETVQLRENGILPGFDYGVLATKQQNGQEINNNADYEGAATKSAWIARSVRATPGEEPSRGPLFYTNFTESRSFERERDLRVFQIQGEHDIDLAPGLRFKWSGNQAETSQSETASGARYFFEPEDPEQIPTTIPASVDDLGPGEFAANSDLFYSNNDIDESQDFGRLDAEYDTEFLDVFALKLASGGWYERAERKVSSSFLESPTVDPASCSSCTGDAGQFAVLGGTPQDLGAAIVSDVFREGDDGIVGTRNSDSDSSREIWAWHFDAKLTLWEMLDLLAGLRLEDLLIESSNEPFTGQDRFGTPDIFPTRYLFFDRLDDPSLGEVAAPPPPGTTFNDQLLGISVPIDPATGLVNLSDEGSISGLVNGLIDERKILPAYGIAFRPREGLNFRAAYSRTVARPSFREMGYYVSVEPGSDDLVVGNPQLTLSDVESWDARAEFFWGDLGDLAAVSVFKKHIRNPIESIVIRDPLNFEGSSSALYRTFFNNPNQALLEGIELEARKNLGFLTLDFLGTDFRLDALDFLQYLSIGGNVTRIWAEVDRIDAELARAAPFFGTAAGDEEKFSGLEPSRRLFGQPEWIVNADISFDHPDWGTKFTLAFFAISDILDAAGSAAIAPNGEVISFTPDRYVDSYHQLDLVMSQTRHIEWLRGDVTLKIDERRFKVGRDWSFSVGYSFSF